MLCMCSSTSPIYRTLVQSVMGTGAIYIPELIHLVEWIGRVSQDHGQIILSRFRSKEDRGEPSSDHCQIRMSPLGTQPQCSVSSSDLSRIAVSPVRITASSPCLELRRQADRCIFSQDQGQLAVLSVRITTRSWCHRVCAMSRSWWIELG